MSFLLYATTANQRTSVGPQGSVIGRGGEAEYSYRFLLDAYRDMLAATETVIEIERPEETDRLHAYFAAHGEPCTLLAFCPPNLAPVGLACPTVCLFAWEFTTLPHGTWGGDPRNDWRHVFLAHGRTIAMSTFAADLARQAMGDYCEVAAIPAPVYDAWATVQRRETARTVRIAGLVRDTRETGIGHGSPHWPLRDPPAQSLPPVPPLSIPPVYVPARLRDDKGMAEIALDGTVFTAIFSPTDGRKNWRDLTSAFIWAFRDTPDATLVIKFVHAVPETFLPVFEDLLFKCGPFACRVVTICGWLDNAQMRELAACTDIYVNTSLGEGMCLPLVEFMSAGVPAIAPNHTAMADYITVDNAFIVHSALEHNVWPHDPEGMFRTMRYRVEWDSIVDAYHQAARMLRGPEGRRAAMSNAARTAMRDYCARARVYDALYRFLGPAAFAPSRTAPLALPHPVEAEGA